MAIQPYLFFNGRCEEAIEFYQKALGAKVQAIMRFDESPQPMPEGMLPPGFSNKVMHSELIIGDSVVMASDGTSSEQAPFRGVELTLIAGSKQEATRWFEALSDGGEVKMPLGKSFFAESFGTLNDRFGVPWMVVFGTEQQAEQKPARSA
jgi:PhnB protein